VIESFVASWPLFHNSYLAGWGIALLLSLLGVWVVARDQIFIGAAVAQASTFGVASGLWIASLWPAGPARLLETHPGRSGAAILFALIATLVTARGGGGGRESHEAITGWVFLVSAAGATLLLAHSPHGLDEIEQLLTSSLIGAARADVWQFAAFSLLALAAIAAARRPLLLFAIDPAMAGAVGMRTRRWGAAVAVVLGVSIGLAIHVAGTLYTFGCLVLPALVARSLAREVGQMLWLSPIVGVSASVAAFVLANEYDYPPAQVAVALLCVALAGAWGWRRFGR
jgi:ABC-type Mn2+/Zn2+ transport system permease subunit